MPIPTTGARTIVAGKPHSQTLEVTVDPRRSPIATSPDDLSARSDGPRRNAVHSDESGRVIDIMGPPSPGLAALPNLALPRPRVPRATCCAIIGSLGGPVPDQRLKARHAVNQSFR
jgi:hypothetical protein